MNSFEIIEYQSGTRGTVYTIEFENDTYNQAEKFFADAGTKEPIDTAKIVNKLDIMTNRKGFADNFFEHQYDVVEKISIREVRLYCLRFNEIILIIGGGGIKTKRRTQDHPQLQEVVNLLIQVNALMDKRFQGKDGDKELKIVDNKLIGDLKFDLH